MHELKIVSAVFSLMAIATFLMAKRGEYSHAERPTVPEEIKYKRRGTA